MPTVKKKRDRDPDDVYDEARRDRQDAEFAFQDGFEALTAAEMRRDEARGAQIYAKTPARRVALRKNEQNASQEVSAALLETHKLGAKLIRAQKAAGKAYEAALRRRLVGAPPRSL